MVKQYPHTITVSWKPKATQDENGNWITPEGDSVFESVCRAEPNGKGQILRGTDGSEIYFAYTVYMPKTSVIIPKDAKVVIGEITGKVKRHENGQLNSRLWL